MRKGSLIASLLIIHAFLTACEPTKPTSPHETTGVVEASLFHVISAQGGQLYRLYVQDGESIKHGQWIAKIKDQTILKSPANGYVADTFYLPKETVPPGGVIATLLFPQQIHILFYVPEQQLHHIKRGNRIQIRHLGKTYSANITYVSMQAEYTPDSIYLEKNRHKSVFKVKARPSQALRDIIHVGQSVDVDYGS